MKRIIVSVLFLLTILLGATACNQNEKPTYEFLNFEIRETLSLEGGTYYDFEKPNVMCGTEKATITITVKKGEQIVPHNNEEVYFDSVGIYVITYTASFGGQKTSKTTTVKTLDTTAPLIENTLKTSIRHNTSVILTDYIKTKDVSKIKEVSYTVTDEDGSALPGAIYNEETTELCVRDESIRCIKLFVTAIDVYDNEKTEDFLIAFTPSPIYGVFNFGYFETNSNAVAGVSVLTNENNTYQTQLVEEKNEKYLSITVQTTKINQYVTVNFSEILVGDYSKFDYVDVEMLLDCTYNGGNGGLVGAEFTAKPLGVKSNIFKEHQGQWFTYTYTGDAARQSIEKNEGIGLIFKPWGEQEVTIKIKSIAGRYEDKKIVDDGVIEFDFESAFGLTREDVKNVSFAGVAVADVENFVPKTSGELVFTVCKNGYKEIKIIIQISIVPVVVDNESDGDNDYEWEW